MNEHVVKMLKEQLWYLATYSDAPNVVPVAFKDVTEDGKLLVGDVFLEATLNNIAANSQVAVAVGDIATLSGYQIKGTALYLTEGPIVQAFKDKVSAMFNGAVTAKGALVITPQKIIVASPGPDVKKEL